MPKSAALAHKILNNNRGAAGTGMHIGSDMQYSHGCLNLSVPMRLRRTLPTGIATKNVLKAHSDLTARARAATASGADHNLPNIQSASVGSMKGTIESMLRMARAAQRNPET